MSYDVIVRTTMAPHNIGRQECLPHGGVQRPSRELIIRPSLDSNVHPIDWLTHWTPKNMKKLITTLSLVLIFVLAAIQANAEEQVISLKSLLNELIDYDHLARWPEPAFTCKQASSYDRASKSPDDKDGWFANGDQNQWIRIEKNNGRTEKVMMDADGPGAIVRFWITSGDKKDGKIRIYLDGARRQRSPCRRLISRITTPSRLACRF